MPLVQHRHLLPEGELGLWQIAEDERFFLEQMTLPEKEAEELTKIKGHRRLEWLASRWLLHILSGREERGNCLKDEFGKPYLEHSLFDISISHSRKYTAVIAAPRLVGVDIQKLVPKIERIAHKYMRPEELDSLETASRLEHLHVYWGAKEALYKAYGRRRLDFREHIILEPFAYELEKGRCRGTVKKEDFQRNFRIFYEKIDNYVLVYALEEVPDQRIA